MTRSILRAMIQSIIARISDDHPDNEIMAVKAIMYVLIGALIEGKTVAVLSEMEPIIKRLMSAPNN